jgi:hypothetical protein
MTEPEKTKVAATNTPEPTPTAFEAFTLKHKDRVLMWMKDHAHPDKFYSHQLPIVDDGKGSLRWLNRAERRKMKL